MQQANGIRIERTGRGARLVQDDVVLSEILAQPGATHTMFDVLAACVAALGGPRFCMLGFAGGGIIAPLRAMGYDHPVHAVDLSRDGEALFRELSDEWAGNVRVTQNDAERWLRRGTTPYDVIVEDISMPSPAGVVKPYATFDALPELIRKRLGPDGIAITNLLPLPGTALASLEARVAHPHHRAVSIALDEYDNRIVIAGDRLPTAREISARVRGVLEKIGSNQRRKLTVRTLTRD